MAERSSDPVAREPCSDSDIDVPCTPCTVEGVNDSAVQYCTLCKEYLCLACTKCHRKFAATRDHLLVDHVNAQDVQQTTVKRFTQNVTCQQHPTKEVSSFCPTHDVVFCTLCAAVDHSKCKGVTTIELTVSSHVNIDVESESTEKEITQYEIYLEKTEQKKRENITQLDEKTRRISNEIEEKRKQLVDKINALSAQDMSELNVTSKRLKAGVLNDISLLHDIRGELEKANNNIKASKMSKKEQRFIHMKNGMKTLAVAKRLNEDLGQKPIVQLQHNKNVLLSEQIMNSTSLVSIRETCTRKRSYAVAAVKKISVKLPNEQDNLFIADICQISDERIVLADHE